MGQKLEIVKEKVLSECEACNNQISIYADRCAKCRHPMLIRTDGALAFSIFICPMVFAWLTCRIGHSFESRFVAFSWMVAHYFIVIHYYKTLGIFL